MVTHFPNTDGSITIRHQGYGPNFVQNLATHLAYLVYDLVLDTCSLDLSLESLKRVEELITDRKNGVV
ncbi:MAG: hypothetical protein EOO63_01885 [Hymenobacter sp.]|nr:MAG: hypothetical protein EOO63_01885 [Hymenobacter sp.]